MASAMYENNRHEEVKVLQTEVKNLPQHAYTTFNACKNSRFSTDLTVSEDVQDLHESRFRETFRL